MTPPILRILGAVAGFGSAVLFWFFGKTLAPPLAQNQLLSLDGSQYALLAFLFIPGLILAVVALFWVPPRRDRRAPAPDGKRWRIILVLVFVAAFIDGLVS